MLITVDPNLRDDLDIGPTRGASDGCVGEVITWRRIGASYSHTSTGVQPSFRVLKCAASVTVDPATKRWGRSPAKPFVAQELKSRLYVCGDAATSTDSRFVPQISLIVLTSDEVDHS
jgi:hypothetical protein